VATGPVSVPLHQEFALMKNLPCMLVFATFALSASRGFAQVQLHPLPEQKPAVALPLGGHELTAADAGTWLDGLFSYALKKNNIDGAVVVVVKDGQVLLSRGYGYADVMAKKPVDPATTLFRLGSISKTFTWTAVMQLVEQGRLDLDADVNKYLDFTIPPRDGKPVTLRELMTHTAGFEEVAKNLAMRASGATTDRVSFESWIRQSLPQRIYPPGEVSAYSNYGGALAGYIVQRVSGQPFEDYIEQHILLPLGMRHASFRQPLPVSLEADMVRSYAGISRSPLPFNIRAAVPAGGLSASGGDMAHFMIAHLQDGHDGDARILQPQTAEQMHGFTHYAVPGLLPITLGLPRMDRNGQTIIGHGGDLPFFHSEMALFLQSDVGVFVAIDGATDGGLRQLLLDGFADRYFPPLPQKSPPTLASARRDGALLVGRYLTSRRSQSNFLSIAYLFGQSRIGMLPDGTLLTTGFRDLAGRPRRWREVRPFIWLDDVHGGHLGARMEHGRLRWISIDEMSPVTVLLPVPAWQSAAWNLPLLFASLLVFLIAAVLWPVAALVRRACGKPFALQPAARRWYRWSRITAILHLLFAAGWVFALQQAFNGALDSRLRLIQCIGVLAIAGTLAVLANAVCAWRAPGGWWCKVNSTALLLACLATIWFTFSLHLLNLHLNY
jgi:CubicO group peptidase (beta-lactamase class C family)